MGLARLWWFLSPSRVQLLQSHGLKLARLLCLWGCPGKNTGVGGHFLLPGYLPDPGIEPGSLALQADFLPTELRSDYGRLQ